MTAVLRALLLLIVVAAIVGGAAAYAIAARGLSTRVEPSAVEERLALAMRSLATPAATRSRSNPVEPTAAVLDDALAHFADHCASCHANSGVGDTEMGLGLYPRAPDMRQAATQNLTDGELFYIIENGVKLTGMPAWGTGTEDSARSTWHLVQFIRRLPSLSESELADMEELNPRSAADWQALDEERRFLSGEVALPSTDPSTHDHKGVPK